MPIGLPRISSPALLLAGRIALSLSIGAFGLRYLVQGRPSAGLPPLPGWLPGGPAIAFPAGLLLLAAGALLLLGIRVRLVSALLGWGLLAACCLHLLHLHDLLDNGSLRTAFLEPLTLAGTAWVLGVLSPPTGISQAAGFSRAAGASPAARRRHEPVQPASAAAPLLLTAGRYLVAATLVVFGIQHFEYLTFVAYLIPPWLHVPRFWVVLTGAALIAAGLAIAIRTLDRLAALLLALMFSLWLLLLHGPRIAHAPHNADEWTSGFVALGFAATGLILAADARAADPRAAHRAAAKLKKAA